MKYRKPDSTPKVHIICKKVLGKEADLQMAENLQQHSFYCIEVRDNGIGFEQAHAEQIFNVFTRLHGVCEYKGAGIGLSIVRKAVENHNGYVWAKSKPGEGCTFNVLLPA